jgi:two-component system, cell cycle sensor histidine kinase and response regulator CckA
LPDDQRKTVTPGAGRGRGGGPGVPAAPAPAERYDMPPISISSGGRFFLFVLFVGIAFGILYYLERTIGFPAEARVPIYATVGMVGTIGLILIWGALRGQRRMAQSIVERIGTVTGAGIAIEEAEGRLTYVNGPFLEFLGLCGAETREEEGLWTMYVFRTQNEAARTFKKLRADALKAVASREIIHLPRSGRDPQRLVLGAAPGNAGEVIWTSQGLSSYRREEALSAELAGLRNQLETVPVGMAVLDSHGCVVECNPACRDLLVCDDPINQPIVEFVRPADRAVLAQRLSGMLDDTQMAVPIDVEIEGTGHRVVSMYFSRRPAETETEAHGPGGLALHMIDTTEKKKLEIQFSQSQKMQAVGQLAGGIAHDFNNLLTAMIGFCDLLLQRYQPGEQSFSDIMQIKQNANRGARLVRQLLAFSRQQTLQPRVLDVTDVLTELSSLLHRLLGESVDLKFVHGRDLGKVKVDQGQLEQVIINLAVNARDAMPRGGKLIIGTRNCSLLSEIDRAHAEIMPAGDYVMITVTDTGIGMPQHVLDRIFDPFFTTKEVGSGTGLGLATVYGIIKQTGGFIFADSEGESKGAIFTIYLQRYEGKEERTSARAPVERPPAAKDLTGGGTIMLVEDEDPVRMFGARALRSKGYEVIEARNGEQAIELLNDTPIDLLITDMVMPKADGAAVVAAARKKMPGVPVICISGYAQESVIREVESLDNVNFLAKPFSLRQLAGKVKEVLEKQPSA